jgi:hypothetical protein
LHLRELISRQYLKETNSDDHKILIYQFYCILSKNAERKTTTISYHNFPSVLLKKDFQLLPTRLYEPIRIYSCWIFKSPMITSINNPTIRASIAAGPTSFALTPAQKLLLSYNRSTTKCKITLDFNIITFNMHVQQERDE